MKYTYSDQQLQDAISSSTSIAQVLSKLNMVPAGGNYFTIHQKIKSLNLNTEHFNGQSWNKGKTYGPKRPLSEYLSNKYTVKSYSLRERLLRENIFPHQCMHCKLTEWIDSPIPLELHHINGTHDDNSIDNLQLLCPNCHTLTDNYRGRKKRKSVT